MSSSPTAPRYCRNMLCPSNHKEPYVAPSKLKACHGCLSPRYCSRKCQKADWPDHQHWCMVMQEQDDPDCRPLAKRVPVWLLTHRQAFVDAFVNALNLKDRPFDFRTHALQLYFVYHRECKTAQCMELIDVSTMEMARPWDNPAEDPKGRWDYYVWMRQTFQDYVRKEKGPSHNAGLVVCRFYYRNDYMAFRAVALPVEITRSIVKAATNPLWMELLCKRTATGTYHRVNTRSERKELMEETQDMMKEIRRRQNMFPMKVSPMANPSAIRKLPIISMPDEDGTGRVGHHVPSNTKFPLRPDHLSEGGLHYAGQDDGYKVYRLP